MSGQQIGMVAGAALGFVTGGIGFVGIGAAIGGVLGGLLDPPPPTETNRIEDIKVSVSVYGDGIPETWGSNIPKATWIWSTDIIQLGTTSSAGKGGPKNTNYQQFLHGYLSLGRTPLPGTIVSIRKAWVDGKLRYDASTGLSSGQALASKEDPFTGLSVHPGFDDQLPHPIIETYEGVGNVPAFKGIVGLFIFGLECPGGRIPQLAFEISFGATLVSETSEFGIAGTLGGAAAPAIWASDGEMFYQYQAPINTDLTTGVVTQVGVGYTYDMGTYASDPGSSYNIGGLVGCSGIGADPYAIHRIYQGDPLYYPTEYYALNLRSKEYRPLYSQIISGAASPHWAGYDSISEQFVFADINGINIHWLPSYRSITTVGGAASAVAAYAGLAYFVVPGAALEVFDSDGVFVASYPGPLPSVFAAGLYVSSAGIYVYVLPLFSSTTHFYKVESGVWRELGTTTSLSFSPPGPSSAFVCNDSFALVGERVTGAVQYRTIRFDVVQPSLALVADIIESQSLRTGLTAPQFDVSTIDDSVWGYTMQAPASARANVAPLLTYGAIGVVEEDGLMRYFHRAGKTYVATISYDELACIENGGEPGDPFPLTRSNADELPRSVTVAFNNPHFDYQITTQSARRDAVDSVLDERVELNIAMEPDKAATIARRILFERWLSQMTRACVIGRKFIYLSPGDVIRVEYPRGTFSDWMISGLTDTGALLEIECFPADGDLLIQTVPGSGGFNAQAIAPLVPPTKLQLLDIPILQDADNNAGIYAAMAGVADGWHGAELFVGDDDSSLDSRGTVALSAAMGLAETALGAWTLGVIDETNVLTVNVNQNELTSITQDVLLTGTDNVAAIGAPGRWEIIKFQRATLTTAGLNGSNRYILSGLLRGQRGTEWARGTHVAGDVFVVLSAAGLMHPSLDGGSIGQIKFYRAVSNGRSFDSIASQTYASTAEGLECFSPTNLDKNITGGDITLSWVRRTRLSENWLIGVVPLGEVSERYETDLYTDGTFATVRRTIASTTTAAVYTAAMQSADGYVAGGPLYVKVYQISDTNGRGRELQATI
jgi:hypothetical protein